RIASVGGAVNRPNHLLVHRVDTGKVILRVPVRTGTGASPAFSPDGRQIFVASGETRALGKSAGGLWAYDAGTHQVPVTFQTEGEDTFVPSFSPDGKSLVAVLGHWDANDQSGSLNEIRVWDARTGMERWKIRNENTRNLLTACFSPDSRTIATCGYDTT